MPVAEIQTEPQPGPSGVAPEGKHLSTSEDETSSSDKIPAAEKQQAEPEKVPVAEIQTEPQPGPSGVNPRGKHLQKPEDESGSSDDDDVASSRKVKRRRKGRRQILDSATGLLRDALRSEETLTEGHSEEELASLEGDAAEDDDFYERRYPSEESESEQEPEAETGQAVETPAATAEPLWRLVTQDDNARYWPPAFDHEPGPTFELETHVRESEYFLKFLTIDLIERAAEETNNYASYHQEHIADKINPRWRRTDFNEMQAYIGMLVAMGVDRKTAIDDYWSSDPFLQNAGIASVMTRAKFQMLSRYFHLSDPVLDPRRDPDEESRKKRCEEDPLYKVNPWLQPILQNCKANYQLNQEISIDEGMVRFKGRSKFKQRLPHKPDRDGFKIWEVCDSKTSYIANFSPYLGVKYMTSKEGKKQQRGAVARTTKELMVPFEGKGHILFCDSLFTTVNVATELAGKGIHMVGSFNRRNRKSMPPQLIPPGKKKRLKLKVGESKSATQTGRNINIVAYQDDNAQILILNTVYPPYKAQDFSDEDRDEDGGDDETLRRVPVCLEKYRQYMGGVDRANQMRKYYHTGRKNNRWWTYFASYLIDVCLVNGYVCFKHDYPQSKLTHKDFQLRVGKQLIGGFSSRSQASIREVGSTSQGRPFIREANMPLHVFVKLPGRQKSCKQCSKEGKKTRSGRPSETSKGCDLCKVHLHEGQCFSAYHHALMLKGKKSVGTQTPPEFLRAAATQRRQGTGTTATATRPVVRRAAKRTVRK